MTAQGTTIFLLIKMPVGYNASMTTHFGRIWLKIIAVLEEAMQRPCIASLLGLKPPSHTCKACHFRIEWCLDRHKCTREKEKGTRLAHGLSPSCRISQGGELGPEEGTRFPLGAELGSEEGTRFPLRRTGTRRRNKVSHCSHISVWRENKKRQRSNWMTI